MVALHLRTGTDERRSSSLPALAQCPDVVASSGLQLPRNADGRFLHRRRPQQPSRVRGPGSAGGYSINVGHELGHKQTTCERWLAKIILAPTGYGHFTIEHNRGHHLAVATPGDPALARMGEGLWRFALRETRLEPAQRNPAAVAAHAGVLYGHDRPAENPLTTFLILSALWANFQLTCANYLEHYGLLRRTLADGTYERCQPYHSWNSNYLFSNWALFHLQRHSDHHTNPGRRSCLTDTSECSPSVQRDPTHINLDPFKREKLMKKYGLVAGRE